jgi:clan AA aspartic protease (TIGR02281 family)
MFYTDVILNNRLKVPALFDAGATYLSLCHTTGDAQQLPLGEGVQLSTANGIIPGRCTTVTSVRIGAIEVRNVRAVVDTPGVPCSGRVLVGISLLRKLQVMRDAGSLSALPSHTTVPSAFTIQIDTVLSDTSNPTNSAMIGAPSVVGRNRTQPQR